MGYITIFTISIHALREEGDSCGFVPSRFHSQFLSTPSARRATWQNDESRGERIFLSTPSARRATWQNDESRGERIFLSTPSARRATNFKEVFALSIQISIHALREEGDPLDRGAFLVTGDFYPRPPRGGRRLRRRAATRDRVFLSTPSARRATRYWLTSASKQSYFYPRPPRGGRPEPRPLLNSKIAISIHALREEGDPIPASVEFHRALFLSTPSARRATAVYARGVP